MPRDVARVVLAAVDQGLEDVVDLLDRQLAHQPELRAQRTLGQAAKSACHPRYPHRVVAYPLQLAGYVLDRHQVAKVARHGLLGGDDHEHLLANLPEQLVEGLVVALALLSRLGVASPQRIEGSLDLRLDERSNADDELAARGQL